MLSVTKKFRFSYGHFLPSYDGPCSRQHGHNALLEVTVRRCPGDARDKGMVVDFGRLKHIVEERILELLDHQNINTLDIVKNAITVNTKAWNNMVDYPTAENMVLWIVASLEEVFKYNLVRVKLYETDDCFVEWERDEK